MANDSSTIPERAKFILFFFLVIVQTVQTMDCSALAEICTLWVLCSYCNHVVKKQLTYKLTIEMTSTFGALLECALFRHKRAHTFTPSWLISDNIMRQMRLEKKLERRHSEMRWRATKQNNVQPSRVSGDAALAALRPALMTGTDWIHTQPLRFWRILRTIERQENNCSNGMVYICIPRQTKNHAKGNEKRRASCWAAIQPETQSTQRHAARGGYECTTGICPKSEIIDAERMKQCKIIKDKNCLLLNSLRGDLIMLLCFWDSSGFWENAGQLLCWAPH